MVKSETKAGETFILSPFLPSSQQVAGLTRRNVTDEKSDEKREEICVCEICGNESMADEPFGIGERGPPGWRRRPGSVHIADAGRRHSAPERRAPSPGSPAVPPARRALHRRMLPPDHAADPALTRSPAATWIFAPGTGAPVSADKCAIKCFIATVLLHLKYPASVPLRESRDVIKIIRKNNIVVSDKKSQINVIRAGYGSNCSRRLKKKKKKNIML